MAYEPNPARALLRSKKFQVLIAWTIYLGIVAYRGTPEQAVDLLSAASWVVAAYLLGQSYVDGKANGSGAE